jgi:two-component system chemotaxis response regulator CheB
VSTDVIKRPLDGARPKVRVVIADDSPTVRVALRELFRKNPDFDLVGIAKDGDEAVDLVVKHAPDVVTMDVAMPNLSGIQAIRRIMVLKPTPVVVFSGLPSTGTSPAFDAFGAGAVDVVAKPTGAHGFGDPAFSKRFCAHLKNMARVSVVGRRNTPPPSEPSVGTTARIIAIAASTGGPPVLAHVLAQLGPESPPVLLVQHMTEGFLEAFATWLDGRLRVRVVMAETGTRPEQGVVYLAPSDRHLELGSIGTIRVHQGSAFGFHRPSAEPLFSSVASHAGRDAVGVILTGMGRDGAKGLAAMRARGAFTIAQDPVTCVVAGMPGAAIEAGAAAVVAVPDTITTLLGTVRYSIASG